MDQPYIELLIDYRESAVYGLNREILSGLNHSVCAIFPGDYHILVNDNVKVVIERKTLPDYAASLKVERAGTAPRITNMQSMYDMKKEDQEIILILLIEHSTIPDLATTVSGIPFTNIQSSIIHHIMRGVSVFWTKNCYQTIDMIGVIMKSMATYKPQISGGYGAPINRETVITNKPKLGDYETVVMAWRQLYGIGAENSLKIAGRFSIREYIALGENITDERLSNIEHINQRAITSLVACRDTKFYDKMLMAIPGVSENKATHIRIALISNPTIDVNGLADVMCGGRKIGKALATRVMRIIDYTAQN